MKKLTGIFLFFCFILPHHLFPFSKGDSEALKKIKQVHVDDVNYRIIAVLPYDNNTKNDDYAYLGMSIQKFINHYLVNLNEIIITTNDIPVPRDMRTNQNVIFNYGTNFQRKAVMLEPDKIDKVYYSLPYPEDKNYVADQFNADYLIYGDYNFVKKDKERFTLKTWIYNAIRKTNYYLGQSSLSKKNIEKDISQVSQKIFEFFSPAQLGQLEIITSYSNFYIFIDDNIIGESLFIDKIPRGPHNLKLKFENNDVIERDFSIKAGEKTILFITNQTLLGKRACLAVNTDPTNANIFLDVRQAGLSPVVVSNLIIKGYRLTIEKEGYRRVFKNIFVEEGMNEISIDLEEESTPDQRADQHKRNKLIMYSTLGLGSLSMLGTYYFFAKSEDEYDEYLFTGKRQTWEKYRDDRIVSLILGTTGIGCLAVSFIYFLKVISYDDLNIGMNHITPGFVSNKNFSLVYFRRF
ncbi:MAG: PEGA domain-containing protein [Spirochaetes bacterium]|nr:PEGA domain-containing protein [Spirochaetota bacterium]